MDPRVPHRKREPAARAPAEGGVWTAREYSKKEKEGMPQEGSDYWSWRKMEGVDWSGHRIWWRPRDSELTEEERTLDLMPRPSDDDYAPLLRYYGSTVVSMGRKSGRSVVAAAMAAAMSVLTTVHKSMIKVDSHSGKHRPARRNAGTAEARLCQRTSGIYGAAEILPPEVPVFGFIPSWLEVRCTGCSMGRLVHPRPGALAAREDGTYRMEDQTENALRLMRQRWGDMRCEDVRDSLTVLAVMGS